MTYHFTFQLTRKRRTKLAANGLRVGLYRDGMDCSAADRAMLMHRWNLPRRQFKTPLARRILNARRASD
jgi:hypothetical protein